MHILIIHQAFAALDEPGGTRHYELARFLVQRGHRVTIIASPVSYITGRPRDGRVPLVEKEQPEAGITVLRTYVYSAHHKSFFHRLIAFFSFMISSFVVGLGVRQVDLVWGTSPPLFQVVTAWALARLKRAKFLFEVRDLWPYFAVAVGVLTNPLLIRLSEWLEVFLYRRADRVMVNSPGFFPHMEARGVRRLEFVPNGADPAMFTPEADGADFRRRYHLPAEAFLVVYAGAHGLSNDLDVVLAAADRLRQEPGIHFALVGDGKEKPRLMARAQELELPNLTFVPSLPKAEVAEALAAADACLAILKPLEAYKTTYPNKVFDYMAAGRPLLLAIDGVSRQVVEAAGCGIFVPPGDPQALAEAARQLAADPPAARDMGRRGRAYLEEHFHRGKLAQQLAEILEDMASD